MKSMTSFARETVRVGGVDYFLEIRTVNGRFRDITLRLPNHLRDLEDRIRREVSGEVDRGRIQVSLIAGASETKAPQLQVNLDLARQYLDGLRVLKEELNLSGEITVDLFTRLRDVLVLQSPEEDQDTAWSELVPGLKRILESLNRMRLLEGEVLSKDLETRVDLIAELVDRIRQKSGEVVRAYAEKLTERIRELAEGIEPERDRILQEAALMADRCDITEEVVRVGSHVKQFKSLMARPEPVGRKLEFLIQELHREINTIGSKSQDAEIAHWVVDAKSEIEKMREQVQNVE